MATELEHHRSACPLDCPDACSLHVTTRHGHLESIEGDARNPVTNNLICAKVRNFAEHVYGDHRVGHPRIRTGPKGTGAFEPIEWDRALDMIAARLREAKANYGGESILPLCYGGSNGYFTQDAHDARLFRRLGASRLLRTVCAAPSGAAYRGLYGRMPGVSFEDYPHAKLIAVWGCNPSATSIHLVPILRDAQRAGSKLVVIDPRRTPLAAHADVHLAVRPGTDLCLALCMIAAAFERGFADVDFLAAHATGVDALRDRASAWTVSRTAQVCDIAESDIERFIDLYASTSPALIRCGWGHERNRNGGSAIAAILALPAVAGKFGVRGGGFTMSNSGAWSLGTEALINAPAPSTREVNMNQVGRWLTESHAPPITVLFVYNANPVATLPDQNRVIQGLLREDLFTVVFDQVMTDTASYADIVLPATTFLEHDEISRGYGSMVLHRSPPVIAPVEQARSNASVFGALLERLDLEQPSDASTAEAMQHALLHDATEGSSLARALAECGTASLQPIARPLSFVDVMPLTSDQKIHLCPEHLDREAPHGLYHYRELDSQYPLTLISPASRHTISSTLAQLIEREATLSIHPDDAHARKLEHGALARVFNERGSVQCTVAIDAHMRTGVVMLPKGLWLRHTRSGGTSNALSPDELSDIGGGATFNDARVEVEPVH